MAGMHGLQLAIDKIDAEIIALAEFEAQLDDAVLKRDIVEDGNAVIRLRVLRDVHHTIDQIDLLMPFGTPTAVTGPPIADVLLPGSRFIAGEFIGDEKSGFCGGERSGKEGEDEETFHGLR